jgi:AraC family transcriptional regulator of adaptative response/methylated-DNA-[protein]-cysteine methyltransferase
VTFEALSPGEYKQQGAALTMRYGFHPTPFGTALVAVTARGICALRFVADGERQQAVADLQAEWSRAALVADQAATAPLVDEIFARRDDARPFHLLLRGTNFQVQVWRALLQIPPGALVSYQRVADYLGRPTASRAVAGAIARNPIGYLIPCHRVIGSSGGIRGYRWHPVRKQALIAWEAARRL